MNAAMAAVRSVDVFRLQDRPGRGVLSLVGKRQGGEQMGGCAGLVVFPEALQQRERLA